MSLKEELETLRKATVNAVIHWAKTGQGYSTMREKFNEFAQRDCSPESSFDLRDVAMARRISARGIIIDSMYALDKNQSNKVASELIDIANDVPQQAVRRGFHR